MRPNCVLCAPLDWAQLALTPIADIRGFTVVRVHDATLPAWLRLISTRHVTDISALDPATQNLMWTALGRMDACLQTVLRPSKINWASLGNMVPHLHWHVVARFDCDAYWPASPWSVPVRTANDPATAANLAYVQEQLPALDAALRLALKDLT